MVMNLAGALAMPTAAGAVTKLVIILICQILGVMLIPISTLVPPEQSILTQLTLPVLVI